MTHLSCCLLLWLWPVACRSTGNPETKIIAAPVVYEELMLIVTSRDAVAAFVFGDEIKGAFAKKTEQGVKYKYRYVEVANGKVLGGSGVVVEKYEEKKTDDPNRFELVDWGSVTQLKAGKLQIDWAFQSNGRGWVYYIPEDIVIQIGHSRDFERIDLKRFSRK